MRISRDQIQGKLKTPCTHHFLYRPPIPCTALVALAHGSSTQRLASSSFAPHCYDVLSVSLFRWTAKPAWSPPPSPVPQAALESTPAPPLPRSQVPQARPSMPCRSCACQNAGLHVQGCRRVPARAVRSSTYKSAPAHSTPRWLTPACSRHLWSTVLTTALIKHLRTHPLLCL